VKGKKTQFTQQALWVESSAFTGSWPFEFKMAFIRALSTAKVIFSIPPKLLFLVHVNNCFQTG
jgi:hypothetical protein